MSCAAEPRPRTCFPLYPKQTVFLDAREAIKAFCGGQGCGKSLIGSYDLLSRVRPGRLYMVITDTFPRLRDSTFRSFREVAEKTGQWTGWFQKMEFAAHVSTRAGGTAEVLFRSAEDPDRLRGPNLSGIWMDEASLLRREAYQIGVARLREAGEAGWLTATFTPKGLFHWSYEVFGKPRPGLFLVQAQTRENPFLDEEFVHRVYQEFTGLRAAQELEGQFVNVEGAEWPLDFFGDHIWADVWPQQFVASALALDPAQGKGEKGCYASFVFVGVDREANLWIDSWASQEWAAPQLLRMGIELCQRLSPSAFSVEVDGGQQFLMDMFLLECRNRKIVLPLWAVRHSAGQAKEVRIREIGPYLSQRKIRFRRDSAGARLLVQQLMDFPVGQFRDGPDALQQGIVIVKALLGQKQKAGSPEIVRA